MWTQQHIQQHLRSPGPSLTFPCSADKKKKIKIRWSASPGPPGTAVFVPRQLEPNLSAQLNICGQEAHLKQLKTAASSRLTVTA